MYKVDDLKRIYKEVCDEDVFDIDEIVDKVNLLVKYFNFDDVEIMMLIDTLIEFKNFNQLDKICDESINLFIKSIGFTEECNELNYIPMLLKHFLLPYNMDKCENECYMSMFLCNFDFLTDTMITQLNDDDYEKLKNYNEELNDLLQVYKKIIKEYEESDFYKYSGVNDKLFINNILSHLKTMLYLNLEYFNYDYNLLDKVFNRIINDYDDFSFEYQVYSQYVDSLEKGDLKVILNEYNICFNMLKREYNPPIVIKRR